MRLRHLVLGVGLAIGLGGAASAAPAVDGASRLRLSPHAVAQFAKWKAKHAFRGRGLHRGWDKKGRHRGVRF